MESEQAEEQIKDLRKATDRGLGEEGRTKEEQDRAMSGDAAPAEGRPEADPDEVAARSGEDERPER